ncbi:hypothetical protein KKB69_02325 [Patescibacteria group bacterium]|nr:hypothetical protein [Patescibacteria group bacterium]
MAEIFDFIAEKEKRKQAAKKQGCSCDNQCPVDPVGKMEAEKEFIRQVAEKHTQFQIVATLIGKIKNKELEEEEAVKLIRFLITNSALKKDDLNLPPDNNLEKRLELEEKIIGLNLRENILALKTIICDSRLDYRSALYVTRVTKEIYNIRASQTQIPPPRRGDF